MYMWEFNKTSNGFAGVKRQNCCSSWQDWIINASKRINEPIVIHMGSQEWIMRGEPEAVSKGHRWYSEYVVLGTLSRCCIMV